MIETVPGYEGRYEVSSLGRVRSVERVHGHTGPYSANNTYVTPQGHRRCRACARERRSMGE